MTKIPAEREPYSLQPDAFAQCVVVLLVMTVAQRGIGFVRSLLFCRWLDVAEVGQWDLTFAFLELATPIAVLSLPACFNRYVEHYRQRGQLRTFLSRTGTAIAVLALISGSVMLSVRTGFSELLYGSSEHSNLVAGVAISLPFLIAYAALTEFFSGFRRYRVVSVLQFSQSATFALLSLLLIYFVRPTAGSIVAAYGLACALCCALPLWWVLRVWRQLPEEHDRPANAAFWPKLAPFIASVWLSNWMGNLFLIVDRYMIVHYSGLDAVAAQEAVGQYHSARILPLLLISVIGLIAGMALPYITCDWEAGRRSLVSQRINLFAKSVCFSLTGVSILLLLIAPMLFGGVLAHKFTGGLEVLPWMLMFSVWFGMLSAAKLYLWCDERVYLVAVALFTGLVANVGANLLLLPLLGLTGAALATCIANVVSLAAVFALARYRGFELQATTVVISLMPLALGLGPWVALAVWLITGLAAAGSRLVLKAKEKEEIFRLFKETVHASGISKLRHASPMREHNKLPEENSLAIVSNALPAASAAEF